MDKMALLPFILHWRFCLLSSENLPYTARLCQHRTFWRVCWNRRMWY